MPQRIYPTELQSYIKHPYRLVHISDPAEWHAIARAVLRGADAATGPERVARLTELNKFCIAAALRHQYNEHVAGNGPFIDISIYLGLIAETSEEDAANWPLALEYRRDIEASLKAPSVNPTA